jgi:hypothetical protein
MRAILLAAGAMTIAFTASQALAAPPPASPKQPIPYSQLNAYRKASPQQQAAKDWSAAAQAPTGADTSALPPPSPVNPPTDAPPASTAVNPPATVAPGAAAPTTPPK